MLPIPMLAAAGAATQLGGAPAVPLWPNPAAVVTNDAAAATAAAAAPSPESLLGRAVRREFAAGFFDGTVVGARITDTFGTLWRILYEDGDEEELAFHDLRCWLVPLPPTAPPVPPPAVVPAPPPAAARSVPPAAVRSAPLPSAPGAARAAPPAAPPAARPASAAPSRAAPPAAARAAVDAAAALPSLRAPSPAAPAAAPPKRAAARAQRKYKGVNFDRGHKAWRMFYAHGGDYTQLNDYPDAESAARAYDTHMRRLGIKVVNFPRAQHGEVQAVFGEVTSVTLRRAEGGGGGASAAAPGVHARAPPPKPKPKPKPAAAASSEDAAGGEAQLSIYERLKLGLRASQPAAAPPSASGARAAQQLKKRPRAQDAAAPHKAHVSPPVAATKSRFFGVTILQLKGCRRFVARGLLDHARKRFTLGTFDTEEEAARACDEDARARGKLRRLNFPVTHKERAAVADFQRGKEQRTAERSGGAAAAAAASAPRRQPTPTQPARKRSSTSVIQPVRKLARTSKAWQGGCCKRRAAPRRAASGAPRAWLRPRPRGNVPTRHRAAARTGTAASPVVRACMLCVQLHTADIGTADTSCAGGVHRGGAADERAHDDAPDPRCRAERRVARAVPRHRRARLEHPRACGPNGLLSRARQAARCDGRRSRRSVMRDGLKLLTETKARRTQVQDIRMTLALV
jgi:hypothetical protein